MDKVEQIWSRIPTIECKGKCWEYCGPVAAAPAELEKIKEYCAKNNIQFHEMVDGRSREKVLASLIDSNCELCPYLTSDKRCSIYPVRPSICRVWGVDQNLPCFMGCKKNGGLNDGQTKQILKELNDIV